MDCWVSLKSVLETSENNFHPLSEDKGKISEQANSTYEVLLEETPTTSSDVSKQSRPAANIAITYRSADPDVYPIATQTFVYCAQKDLENPVEILRYFQKQMTKGRALEVENIDDCDHASTNFVLVDRQNFLETSIDEIKKLKDYRVTLQVQFYGEVRVFCI